MKMKSKERAAPFPSYMRNKLEYLKSSKLDIKYHDGKIITVPLTNVEIIVPHIITFRTNNTQLSLLYYGNYEENRNRLYTMDLSEEIAYSRIKEIIRNME